MWVFYLISLPLTMGMVGITLWYFAGPDVARYVLFIVGYTWFCSLSIIILVPSDIWTVRCLIMLLWLCFYLILCRICFWSLVFYGAFCCGVLDYDLPRIRLLISTFSCFLIAIVLWIDRWHVPWLLKIIAFEKDDFQILMDYRAVRLKTIRFRFRILIFLNKTEWLPFD